MRMQIKTFKIDKPEELEKTLNTWLFVQEDIMIHNCMMMPLVFDGNAFLFVTVFYAVDTWKEGGNKYA